MSAEAPRNDLARPTSQYLGSKYQGRDSDPNTKFICLVLGIDPKFICFLGGSQY